MMAFNATKRPSLRYFGARGVRLHSISATPSRTVSRAPVNDLLRLYMRRMRSLRLCKCGDDVDRTVRMTRCHSAVGSWPVGETKAGLSLFDRRVRLERNDGLCLDDDRASTLSAWFEKKGTNSSENRDGVDGGGGRGRDLGNDDEEEKHEGEGSGEGAHSFVMQGLEDRSQG